MWWPQGWGLCFLSEQCDVSACDINLVKGFCTGTELNFFSFIEHASSIYDCKVSSTKHFMWSHTSPLVHHHRSADKVGCSQENNNLLNADNNLVKLQPLVCAEQDRGKLMIIG